MTINVNQLQTYLVWNEEKISSAFGISASQQNPVTIGAAEHAGDGALSSLIQATPKQMEKFCEVVNNEFTNSSGLCRYMPAIPEALHVIAYRAGDYDNFNEALSMGGFYDTQIIIEPDDLFNQPTLRVIVQAMKAVEDAYGQNDLKIVLARKLTTATDHREFEQWDLLTNFVDPELSETA